MICGIIAYYPDVEQLFLNIKRLNNLDISVVVYRNSIVDFGDTCSVSYLGDGVNRGLAVALNKIVEHAIAERHEFVLFLDQDTNLSDANLHAYLEQAKNNNCFDLLFPRYEPCQSAVQYFTSGSLCRAEFVEQCGGFNELLFIDEVDGEFVQRARGYHARIVFAAHILLDHTLGSKIERRIFGRTLISDNHSPLRKYYISRNRTYLSLRGVEYLKLYWFDSLKKLIVMLCVERDRPTKLAFVFLGMFDGIIGNMGKKFDR